MIYSIIDAIKINQFRDHHLNELLNLFKTHQKQKIYLCCSELHAAAHNLNKEFHIFDTFKFAASLLKVKTEKISYPDLSENRPPPETTIIKL